MSAEELYDLVEDAAMDAARRATQDARTAQVMAEEAMEQARSAIIRAGLAEERVRFLLAQHRAEVSGHPTARSRDGHQGLRMVEA